MSSRTELFVHLVWRTRLSQTWITPEISHVLSRYVAWRSRRLGCELLAFGSAPDHVHLAIRLHPAVSVAAVAKDIKGASSHHLNHHCVQPGHPRMTWQTGYGAFTFGKSEIPVVTRYIESHEGRHARQAVVESWERVPAPDNGAVSAPGESAQARDA